MHCSLNRMHVICLDMRVFYYFDKSQSFVRKCLEQKESIIHKASIETVHLWTVSIVHDSRRDIFFSFVHKVDRQPELICCFARVNDFRSTNNMLSVSLYHSARCLLMFLVIWVHNMSVYRERLRFVNTKNAANQQTHHRYRFVPHIVPYISHMKANPANTITNSKYLRHSSHDTATNIMANHQPHPMFARGHHSKLVSFSKHATRVFSNISIISNEREWTVACMITVICRKWTSRWTTMNEHTLLHNEYANMRYEMYIMPTLFMNELFDSLIRGTKFQCPCLYIFCINVLFWFFFDDDCIYNFSEVYQTGYKSIIGPMHNDIERWNAKQAMIHSISAYGTTSDSQRMHRGMWNHHVRH